MILRTIPCAALMVTALFALNAEAKHKNGFDLSGASIPVREILSGGPPRDGIQALSNPEFVAAGAATYLDEQDRVLAVVIGGRARAYPIRILDWHEIVNDHIGDRHFAVTYCPLCGTGVVFAATIDGTTLSFGVSGLLYNSDVLLYDRNTESLWSQLMGKAIAGRLRDTQLQQLPAFHTTWGDWRRRHPETEVMSIDTGFDRDYQRSPYAGYAKTRRLYFRVSNKAPAAYHPKEQVLGVLVDGISRAYPFSELSANGSATVTDQVNGTELTIHWNEQARSAHVTDDQGNDLPATVGFWFAWYTFHPDTQVFVAAK